MKIKESDFEFFKKLKIRSAIDLALLLPKKIENLSPSKNPKINEICTQKILIKNVDLKKNQLFGLGFCKEWNINVSFVFFHPKTWHLGSCKIGKTLILSGKISRFNQAWHFNNPRILSSFEGFTPKYQILGLKDAKIAEFIHKYLNYDNLKESGIKDQYIHFLLNLHLYDEKSCFMLANLQKFTKDLKYIEIYNFLKRLQAKKTHFKAHDIEIFNINTWLENLPFAPTKDQLRALEDIKKDLRSKEAKRRVIMGDVGCGKTLVLLGAALMVYPKQAILMAPTSILANQLYEEAKKLLPDFVNVLFIKGGRKEKDLQDSIKKAHLIIGTHALIHIKAHDAVLVMIDEQHRFGSAQREKIHALSQGQAVAHFIQFSATPIPRTLSMIQSELLDFSFIKEMPFKKDITTYCIQNEGFAKLSEKIKEELAKNHQVIIIYPLVSASDTLPYLSLEQARGYWESHYDKVFLTHGKDKQKEAILERFRDEGNILLSTTVVEVGISLPRLSMIVIVGAERLGLATLHQLRGRVGRVGLKSTCYLYTKLKEIPHRLKEFAKTLDGFKIAELDLQNRLSGDLLDGFIQHGNEFKFFDFSKDEKILEKVKKDLAKDQLN
ncbi:ATP-dependent DNA helicase RecG [Campylobacter sp. VicNov18]|uniref:ATP-dependent DNA helicase RecG n=1 Tax=Campylobacter bilis TaxID=2691918 RepID=UPI00130D72E8|nr:ATP-dependent DNA helicase RecG [Campylobacter bilis]MPV64008.1 ATP-dependent DNA helicase RecG [Campylobacter hepaticus]MBM0637509.1 ATP-dependent DNA helicase RecG [Campylobacter bilis]MCC8278231.1 ATP-dependent DNA helicase RecG [Campylobacter bilis]MCC8299735.1 ATP-dependent DNA helicase RecG [Campylobacter bilis]MCC8301140.1 ATP-dependent DNA helicase RecG [Campylobacter bilis]